MNVAGALSDPGRSARRLDLQPASSGLADIGKTRA